MLFSRWKHNTGQVRQRDKKTTSAFQLRQFYARRFLHIFPTYCLVIGITVVLNVPLAREIWGWLVTYTSNIYITVHNTWIGYFSHFWSLAVEEQFYLISRYVFKAGKNISFPVFVYLGKISYGIYIYHYFMPLILVPVMKWLGFEVLSPGPLNFILAGSLSIAIASLSWHLFEYPINRLKRHFEYSPGPNAEHQSFAPLSR